MTSFARGSTPVEWQFCPRCETQLQGERPVCPACGYDPDEPAPPPDPDAGVPYSERYRALAVNAAPKGPRLRAQPVGRTRLLVTVALLAIVGLYGSMVMVNESLHRAADTGASPTRAGARR